MDIKQLHTFETIIQTGSFQKAAQVLSYAPSTITFQMKQLEKELGVSLFERRGHEQRLTSAGISLKPYVDAEGHQYLPMSQQPIMIHGASKEQLQELLQKGLFSEGLAVSIYTEELFETFDDEANRASVAGYQAQELNLVGIGLRGKKNKVDRLTKGLPLHE